MASAQEEFDELMRDKSRREVHPEDDVDGRSFLNISDDEDDDVTPPPTDEAMPRQSMSSFRSTIPQTRYLANTGPKGVIADAQHWRDSCRTQRRAGPLDPTLAARANVLSLSHQPTYGTLDEHSGQEDEEEEDFDDVDDDFMERWRQSRIQELQSGLHENRSSINISSRRLFGGMTTVDGEGYLDAVDKSPLDTLVIVYVYDDQSDVSTLIEQQLRQLASKHQDTRFVRLHYEDAQMEPAGVPALIAYRNGDKFAGLVPLINELPDDADLDANTIETVLKRRQILR